MSFPNPSIQYLLLQIHVFFNYQISEYPNLEEHGWANCHPNIFLLIVGKLNVRALLSSDRYPYHDTCWWRELPLRKSSRPWAKYGGRTRTEERRDAKSARNAASSKSTQIVVGSLNWKMLFSSLTHLTSREFVAVIIKRTSTFDCQRSDLKAPPCEKYRTFSTQ